MGICLAVRNNLTTQIHIHQNISDYALWCDLKGPVLSKSKSNIIIGIVYIPPEGSPYFNKDTFTVLQDEINNLSTDKHILLLGDFNARTQSLPDYVICNTEVNNPIGFSNELLDYMNEPNNLLNIGIPLQRTNQDNCKPNSHGYKRIEFFKNNNLYIVNGRVCDDKRIGKITCKGTSVVVYAIASLYILQNIIKFKVLDFEYLYSDIHSPLIVSINILSTDGQDDIEDIELKPRTWNKQLANTYSENINRETIDDIVSNIDKLSENFSKEQLNVTVGNISSLFVDTATNTFGYNRMFVRPKRDKHKAWFGNEGRKCFI